MRRLNPNAGRSLSLVKLPSIGHPTVQCSARSPDKRVRDIDEGKAKLIPWQAARRMIMG